MGCAPVALLLWLTTFGPAVAKEPAPGGDPAEHAVERLAARKALDAKDYAKALEHCRAALAVYPDSALVLEDLIEASANDADVRALAMHRWLTATVDKNGRFAPSKALAPHLPKDDAAWTGPAKARARAATDVVKAIGRAKGAGKYLEAQGLRALLRRILAASPSLRHVHRDDADRALDKARPTTASVLKAMAKAASKAQGSRNAPLRLRLGRAFTGIASHARQSMRGTPNGSEKRWADLGNKLVLSAERDLEDRQMEPLTLEALEAMEDKPEAIRAFNDAHTDIATPGRSRSKRGRYDIVSTCGYGTQLAATKWVEVAHDRLAAYFGGDPFERTPGLVRIVPTPAELERENAPYWWAAGFQQGSITRMHFSHGTAMDMMRTLAHELTHRFDGAFHSAMPTWAVEGHAVWAEGAFHTLDAKTFDMMYCDAVRIAKTWQWYFSPHGLRELLEGKIKDYRDNYTAGHALWIYLSTWKKKGVRIYEEPFAAWKKSLKSRIANPTDDFTARFCDGASGRPSGLQAFCDAFRAFVEGFQVENVKDAPPWVREYTLFKSKPRLWRALDAPSLHRNRDREEPSFGQDHIIEGARVLAALEDRRAAVGLLEWAIVHDEVLAMDLDVLLEQLVALGAHGPATALLIERERHARGLPPSASRVDRTKLAPPSLGGFLNALEQAVELREAQGLARTALALRKEHDALASWVGRARLPPSGLKPPKDMAQWGRSRRLDAEGWVSDTLAGYDRVKQPDKWATTAEGHLLVGTKALSTVNQSVRAEEARVFVRSKMRVHANYRLRCRVQILTPFIRGAVVFGHRRLDRATHLSIEAGAPPKDGDVAEGRVRHVRIRAYLDTHRAYDRRVIDEGEGGTVMLDDVSRFTLEIDVRGPRADVRIDGRHVGRMTDAEGLPVDGHIGFAVKVGAMRIESPVVYDLDDVTAEDPRDLAEPSVARPRYAMGSWVEGCRFDGIPEAPHGSVVIWLPKDMEAESAGKLDREIESMAARVDADLTELLHRARIDLAIPKVWSEAKRAKIAAAFKKGAGERAGVLEHGEQGKVAEDGDRWGIGPTFLFIDPRGIVRLVRDEAWPGLKPTRGGERNAWWKWIRLTRGF